MFEMADEDVVDRTLDSKQLLDNLKQLFELEETDYVGAKDIVASRNGLRKEVRGMLEQRTELPIKSDIYAGLVEVEPRVDWKGAFAELVEIVPDGKRIASEIIAKYQKRRPRLKYGKVRDFLKRPTQMEFEYITPKDLR